MAATIDVGPLTDMWITRYRDDAPERLRAWASEPVGGADAGLFLERMARLAERRLARRRTGSIAIGDRVRVYFADGGPHPALVVGREPAHATIVVREARVRAAVASFAGTGPGAWRLTLPYPVARLFRVS